MKAAVFALPGNEALAEQLAARVGCESGACVVRRFPDGESYLRFDTPVRDRTAVLTCTLDHPDDKLLRVYLAARTLRSLGARRVLLVAPYLPYMRQDRVFQPGEGINAQHVAELLAGCVDGLITVDPHLHRITALGQVYRVPSLVVSAAGAVSRWISAQVSRPLLIGPDEESEQWVSAIAQRVGCPFRVLRKTRHGDRAVSIEMGELNPGSAMQPVLVDDIVSSGGTLIETTRRLIALQLPAPVCVVVHGLFAGTALQELQRAGALRVAACNTVSHAAESIDLAAELAAALAQMLDSLDRPGGPAA